MNRIRKRLPQLRDWLLSQNISRKISLVFLVFFLCSVSITFLLYRYVSSRYAAESMIRSCRQTLTSVRSNVVDMIKTADSNYSLLLKVGIADVFQKPMVPETQKKYDNYLFTLVDTYNHLESIYITDFGRRLYGVDKTGMKSLKIAGMQDAPWYGEAMKANGSHLLCYNAGDIFEKNYRSDFISVIRVINDLETQRPVGFALLNLPVQSVSDLFQMVFAQSDTQIALYDSSDRIISNSLLLPSPQNAAGLMQKLNAGHPFATETKGATMTAGLYVPEYDWKLVADFTITAQSDMGDSLITITLLMLLVNAVLILFCAVLLSRSVSNPIHRMIRTMQGVKNGDFHPVEVRRPNSEIGELQNNYNLMIAEIQSLIQRLVDEQKTKRKAELRVLQEQIKPHFLYNTLDAIGCMALTDSSESVYDAIETLGSFYRHSLSGGGQMIALREEVQIVRDYLALLCLRYDELFTVEYGVEEETLSCCVLKLMLQPLIENCVYHGIKPMGGAGKIRLTAKRAGGSLHITVTDNGVGMDEKTKEHILSRKDRKGGDGFGLIGTMKRVQICYGERSQFLIDSKYHVGTKIDILIPFEESSEEAPYGTPG